MANKKTPTLSRTSSLTLFSNGEKLGLLEKTSSGLSFRYDEKWIDIHPLLPISRRFPIQENAFTGKEVETYFENLLPDRDEIRARIASEYGLSSTRAFDLLAVIGKDCVGALQLTPLDAPPLRPLKKLEGEKVSDAKIAAILKRLKTTPLGDRSDEDFRISIAGAQEKTALLRLNGKWLKPVGATPTTHILKPQIGTNDRMDLSHSVENEWLCMEICRAYGLRTAETEILDFEDQRVLSVERFDRVKRGKVIDRIIQEDFCQATGTPSHLKYENQRSGVRGGPGIVTILEILRESTNREQDQTEFLKAQIIFWLLCAIDGHAKNFSIQWKPSGLHLTPIYDVLSAEPLIIQGDLETERVKLAMAVGKKRHYRIREIQARHWIETATRARLPIGLAESILEELVEKTDSVLNQVSKKLPRGFKKSISEPIFAGVKKRVRLLE